MAITSKTRKFDARKIVLTGENPRNDSSFDLKDLDFKRLFESMNVDGFRDDKPLVCSEREDGSVNLLQGHRRRASWLLVLKNHPDWPSEVQCTIFKGMSLADEARCMIDHFLVKDLNRSETYEAIERLRRSGMSEPDIMRSTGLSRFTVQRAGQVMGMPTEVENAYLDKLNRKEGEFNFTDADLQKLAVASTADREEAKATGVPIGPDGGPNFVEAWAAIVGAGGNVKDPRARTRKDLLGVIGVHKEPILIDVLRYAAGDAVDLNSVLRTINVLRDKAAQFDALNASEAAAS